MKLWHKYFKECEAILPNENNDIKVVKNYYMRQPENLIKRSASNISNNNMTFRNYPKKSLNIKKSKNNITRISNEHSRNASDILLNNSLNRSAMSFKSKSLTRAINKEIPN